MTVIQPVSEYKNIVSLITGALALISVFMFAGTLYVYQESVDMRHELAVRTKLLEKIHIESVELKDALYGLTDTLHLKGLVGERNLVEDKSPSYFRKGSILWAAARSY